MTFTYPVDPSGSTSAQVRFLLSDTVETDLSLTDEEISWLLSQWGDVYSAAAAGAAILSTRYAQQSTSITKTVGDLTISESYAARSQDYAALRNVLLSMKADLNPPTPWADPQAMTATEDKAVAGKTADMWIGRFDFRGGDE